ncbi:unnamed protein product [Prorocentrum cordatum]|uniref:Uncharacterized protein n=1 Tax=Prorocentrum cordatum TaxID=2364126 RepID=A0ABN9PL92_9DINO|nr:unnamed protein product [Polarella glacialis]
MDLPAGGWWCSCGLARWGTPVIGVVLHTWADVGAAQFVAPLDSPLLSAPAQHPGCGQADGAAAGPTCVAEYAAGAAADKGSAQQDPEHEQAAERLVQAAADQQRDCSDHVGEKVHGVGSAPQPPCAGLFGTGVSSEQINMALSSEVTKVKDIDGAKIRSGRYAALSTVDDEDSHDADGCSSGGEGGMEVKGKAESRLGHRGSRDGGTEDDDAILNQAMAAAAAEWALHEAELDGKAAVGGDSIVGGTRQLPEGGVLLSHSARLDTQDSDGLEGEPDELEEQKLQQQHDLLRAKELELDQLTAEEQELQQQYDLLKAKKLEHDQRTEQPMNRGQGPEVKRGRAAARRRGPANDLRPGPRGGTGTGCGEASAAARAQR